MSSEYTYQLKSFEAEAAKVLVEAREKAREMLRVALAESARQKAAADKQGFDKGYAEGLARGEADGLKRSTAELKGLPQMLDAALKGVEARRVELQRQAEKELVTLAVAIAERIVRAKIAVDPEAIGAIVRDAVAMTTARHTLVIEVHPDDAKAARKAVPALEGRFAEIESVKIAENVSIARGGCVVRAASGEIDATLETRLANIREAVLGKP